MRVSGDLQSVYLQNANISLTRENTVSDLHASGHVVSREELVRCFKNETELSLDVAESNVIFSFSAFGNLHASIAVNESVSLQCRIRATIMSLHPMSFRVQVECLHQTCSHYNSIEVADHRQSYLWSGCETIRDAYYVFSSLWKVASVTVRITDVFSLFNATVAFRSLRIRRGEMVTLKTRYMSPTRGTSIHLPPSSPSVCQSVSL